MPCYPVMILRKCEHTSKTYVFYKASQGTLFNLLSLLSIKLTILDLYLFQFFSMMVLKMSYSVLFLEWPQGDNRINHNHNTREQEGSMDLSSALYERRSCSSGPSNGIAEITSSHWIQCSRRKLTC